MKKIILLPILLLTIFLFVATFIDVKTPSKLPDGKNYIDSNNVFKEERFIYVDEPFLVKENTKYTFSVSRAYVDGSPFEAIIEFYEDTRLINVYSKDDWTMSFDIPTNTYYFTFTTPLKTNYIDLRFVDNGDYVTGDELVDVQLEEGDIFTEYEPYVNPNFFESTLFIIIFGSVIIVGTLGGLYWHYRTNYSNPKSKRK